MTGAGGLLRGLVQLLAVMLLSLAALAAAARAPLRVGVTLAVTGPYAEAGKAELEGILLWVHDVNQRGGLLGRSVELVHYDDQSDPYTSERLYERLISEDHVDLLLGPYGTDVTLAASWSAERHNFPMVATGAAGGDIWSRGLLNIFGVDAQADDYANLLIADAAAAGLERVALLYADSSFPREVARGARREAERHSMVVVYERDYPPQQSDFTALVRELRAARPQLVIVGSYLDDAIALTRAAAQARLTPCAMAFTVGPALDAFSDALGDQAEGILGLVPWMRSAALPLAMDFSYRYKRLYGHNASAQAALGYGGAQVLEAAVRLAGSLDRNAVRSRLRDMRFGSLLGRYRVDASGRQVAKRTYVLQIQDGHRELVLPQELQESPLRYRAGCRGDAPVAGAPGGASR